VEYLLVTVNYTKNNGVDMKIPAFMPVEEFISIICQIYGINESTLQAEPLGILLNKKQSFAEQQVEHGALLTFRN